MHATTTRAVLASILALHITGCGPEGPDQAPPDAPPRSLDRSPPVALIDDASNPLPLLPGAGWIDVAESLVKPYCSAVQVAPDRVVTSAGCAYQATPMRFGTGEVGVGGQLIAALEPSSSDPRLVNLRLAEPATDAEMPVVLKHGDTSPVAVDGARVVGASYGFVGRDESSERWFWGGTLVAREGVLEVDLDQADGTPGAPNCHGDNGAGVYTEAGQLVGVVVAASGSSEQHCVTRLVLASP